MMPIVSTLERGQFTVKLHAYSSQREDYEEFPITVDVCVAHGEILMYDDFAVLKYMFSYVNILFVADFC